MKKSDSVVVSDGSGRRRFIRVGAAFLLAQSAATRAQDDSENFRTDCDSQGYSGQKNAEAAGNDSDTGANADRPGCGRKLPLTQLDENQGSPFAARPVAAKKVSVTKIKA